MSGDSKKPDADEEDLVIFNWVSVEPPAAQAPAPTPPAPAPPKPEAPRSLPPPALAKPAPIAPPPAEEEELGIHVPEMPPHRTIPLPPRPKEPTPPVTKAPPLTAPPLSIIRPEPRPAPPKPAAPAPSRPAVTPVAKAAPAPSPVRGRRRRSITLPDPKQILMIVGVPLLLAGGYVFFSPRPPKVAAASPARVRPGELLTLQGEHFSEKPEQNVVAFDGKPGKVVRASPDRIEVEAPEDMATAPGRDSEVSVTITTRGRSAAPVRIASYRPPVVRALEPDVAMPGDEVTLSGSGWGSQARVSFGPTAADVVEATPETIRVKVPALEAASGTSLSVVVAVGSDRSAGVPFLVGRLPLLLGVEPKAAAEGDLVTLKGKGFRAEAAANQVQIGGARALVVASTESELKVVVPTASRTAGPAPVEIRVPGNADAAKGEVTLPADAAMVAFKFVAEPLADAPGHDHAALVTPLGPAFVLSAAGGETAAARALEAQRQLNGAAALLAAEGASLEIREAAGRLEIALAGRPDALLQVTEQDAAAYNESGGPWRGNGGRRVTPRRLALWWLALTRDLSSLLLASGPTRHVAALTPEGRFLAELDDVGRRAGGGGLPRRALDGLRPETRKGLQSVALRVPPALEAEAAGGAKTPPAGATAAEDPLQLAGVWTGTSTEEGVPKELRVTFTEQGGSLSYLKPVQFSVQISGVERPRIGSVRFSIRVGTGSRYYEGRWDGETLSGAISSNADGTKPIGRFELRR